MRSAESYQGELDNCYERLKKAWKRMEKLEAVAEAARHLESDFEVFTASDGEEAIRPIPDFERKEWQKVLHRALEHLDYRGRHEVG